MRTKAIILGAALLAAGAATSMAQSNVYSLNVVGYINLNMTNGYNLVANQLDFDGTGTNNTIIGVFSNNLPVGSIVYKFVSGSFNNYIYGRGGWPPSANGVSFNPGEALFITIPSPVTITTVGQVLQGTYTNTLSGGYTMAASVAPLSGTLDSTGNGGLNYVPSTSDILYLWDPVNQVYDNYLHGRGGWSPSDPVISVGQGIFLSSPNTTWVNTFTVQ
jgi:hypothetical protein